MTDKPKRPPSDRGQGRKSLSGSGKSPIIRIRCSKELAEKVKTNGPDWAREILMKAKPIQGKHLETINKTLSE